MTDGATAHYLSRAGLAEAAGVHPGSLSRMQLPPPDAIVAGRPAWLPETATTWAEARAHGGYAAAERELAPAIYLGRAAVERRLGLPKGSLNGVSMPVPPDATVSTSRGPVPGWLPATIDRWDANRVTKPARRKA